MTNKNRQKSLDEKKWNKSFEYGTDLSGSMAYCEFCEFNENGECLALQEEREDDCLCAKAYNRMKRK